MVLLQTENGFVANEAWFCCKQKMVLLQMKHGFVPNGKWFAANGKGFSGKRKRFSCKQTRVLLQTKKRLQMEKWFGQAEKIVLSQTEHGFIAN